VLSAVLLSLALGGHEAGNRSAAALRSTRWAERVLARSRPLPSALGPFDLGRMAPDPWPVQAFEGVIRRYGGSARAYRGLAEAQQTQGDYAYAVRSLDRALRLQPRSRGLRWLRAVARRGIRAERRIAAQRGASWKIGQLLPLGDPRTTQRWIALVHRAGAGYETLRELDAYAGIFNVRGSYCRLLWRTPTLHGDNDARTIEASIYLVDLTADGRPELVTRARDESAPNWAPEVLQVYDLRRLPGRKLDELVGEQGFCFAAPERGGPVGVGAYTKISGVMPTGMGPMWPDYYELRHGRFMEANSRFPGRFRPWPGIIEGQVEEFPADMQMLEYLMRVHTLLGEREPAIRVLRRWAWRLTAMIHQQKQPVAGIGTDLRQVLAGVRSSLAQLRMEQGAARRRSVRRLGRS
jgi:hypothetical protein